MAAITTTASPKNYFTRAGAAQADTGQTDWLLVPSWANYAWVMVNLTAVAGTTPTMDISFPVVDPVSLDDAHVLNLAEHGNLTDLTGAATVVVDIGPSVTGIADEVTVAATGDSYATLNAVLPPVLGVKLTLDRTEADETYSYNLAVLFRP